MTTQALPRDESPAGWRADGGAAAPSVAGTRTGLRFVDAAILALIGIVVVLVSLPRLRRFAVRENESDAIRMLQVLASDAAANGEALATGRLSALLAASTAHRVRLEDVEVLPDGRLRRHGYVFGTLARDDGRRVIVAWPWEHGRTGLAVFAIEPGGTLLGLRNEDGRFSGLASPPPAPPRALAAPWRAVAAP